MKSLFVILPLLLAACAGPTRRAASDFQAAQARPESIEQRLSTTRLDWVCDDVALSDVLSALASYLQVEIRLLEPEAAARPATVMIQDQSAAEVLDMLALRFDLNWKVEAQCVLMRRASSWQASTDLRTRMAGRREFVSCENLSLEELLALFRTWGVEIVPSPEVDLNVRVSLETHTQSLDLLLDLLLAVLDQPLDWAVYGGQVHLFEASPR